MTIEVDSNQIAKIKADVRAFLSEPLPCVFAYQEVNILAYARYVVWRGRSPVTSGGACRLPETKFTVAHNGLGPIVLEVTPLLMGYARLATCISASAYLNNDTDSTYLNTAFAKAAAPQIKEVCRKHKIKASTGTVFITSKSDADITGDERITDGIVVYVYYELDKDNVGFKTAFKNYVRSEYRGRLNDLAAVVDEDLRVKCRTQGQRLITEASWRGALESCVHGLDADTIRVDVLLNDGAGYRPDFAFLDDGDGDDWIPRKQTVGNKKNRKNNNKKEVK